MKQVLVRISKENHKLLRQIQDWCRERGKPIPSIASLANDAIAEQHNAPVVNGPSAIECDNILGKTHYSAAK